MRSLLVGAMALLAIGCGTEKLPGAAASDQAVGQTQLALSAPLTSGIDHIDYTLTFTFLDTEPPTVYNTEEMTSVRLNGELIVILPCWTTSAGTGLNQVDIAARIYFNGQEEPVEGFASTLFTCVRNADTPVNVLLNVVAPLDGGFVDVDVAPTGTLCASKIDYKGDSYLGVCPEANCGDQSSVFVFANNCHTARGTPPSYWVCGDNTDWVLDGSLANSLFPIPEADGSWTFGVIAIDRMRMAQTDLSLTDAEGYLKVFAGISASFADIERRGGELFDEIQRTQFEFAAELQVPPRAAGQPAPTLLLTLDNTDLGASASVLERFGACQQPVSGVRLYAQHDVVDVRRDGEHAVTLFFREKGDHVIKRKARCEAQWDALDQPTIDCDAPSLLREETPGAP